MIIDSHCHVIATDTKKYPLKPLFGKQSDWSAEHPLDYPDMVAADQAAGIDKAPLYYTDIAERFSDYDFNTVARAIGHLHKIEKLWQDSRGRMCVRGSKFAAVLPVKK